MGKFTQVILYWRGFSIGEKTLAMALPAPKILNVLLAGSGSFRPITKLAHVNFGP